MSERQITACDQDTGYLRQLTQTASSELGGDKSFGAENALGSQLWSDDPEEVTRALQETGDLLKHRTEVFDIAYDVVDKDLERLISLAECGDTTLELLAMQTIYDAWMGSDQDDPRLIAVFKSLLPKIIAHYPSSKKTKELPFQSLAKELIDDFTRPSSTDRLNFAFRLSNPDLPPLEKTRPERRTAKLMDHNILEAFGYHQSTTALAEHWQDGMKKTRRKNDIAHAMQVMSALETTEPGTVDSLNKTNGIRNFQRYDPDMLYQMYRDQIEHPEKDYVLLIQSVSDHNDAFKRPDTYMNLYARLKKMGYGLRIYECGNLDELDEITEKVLRNYTAHNAKVVSELMLGHGDEDGVELSKPRHALSRTRLTAHHLDKTIHSNIAHAMTKDAWTRFISCSTGKETKGKLCISKEVAIAMGKMAIAPTARVGFGNMRPIRSGDGVNVMVEYIARKGRGNGNAHYVQSRPAVFNGKTTQSDRMLPNNHDIDDIPSWGDLDAYPLRHPAATHIDLTDELPTDSSALRVWFE